jgi:hypothetical protein
VGITCTCTCFQTCAPTCAHTCQVLVTCTCHVGCIQPPPTRAC